MYGETSLGKDAGCDETTTLEPTNPYSAAKAGAEMMVRSYMTSYRMPCIITRGNNVYGPHQFPEKLIPKMTLLAHRGQELPVHGDGKVRCYKLEGNQTSWAAHLIALLPRYPPAMSAPSRGSAEVARSCAKVFMHFCMLQAVRSYLHVRDVARAFDTVLHKGVIGQVYNIGTQKERSVLDVVGTIAKHLKVDTAKIKHVEDRAFNDQRCALEKNSSAVSARCAGRVACLRCRLCWF